MRRLLAVVFATAAIIVAAPVARAVPTQFLVVCGSSHVASVDPIVSPGTTSAHEHEFFGNKTTAANSTYASMLAGATTCSTVDDTAGYWTPTLLRTDGSRVRADSMLVYYYGSILGRDIQPFPANLKMVSDQSSFVSGSNDTLRVVFPSCWDGFRLDSLDHRSHMAFPMNGLCPASHPVTVPRMVERFRYNVDVRGMRLSSGTLATGHADFWNTWRQSALVDLTNRCLNGTTTCGRIDSP